MKQEQLEAYLQSRLPFYLAALEKMVRTNSHTENRSGVAANSKLCAELFSSLDFQADSVPCTDTRYGSHLFLNRPGSRNAQILLVSHLDTVFSEEEERKNNFSWRLEGDRIYGPGTIDIKGGTLSAFMMLDALRALDKQNFEDTHWLVALNAAEEPGMSDFAAEVKRRASGQVLACLVFEAGKPDTSCFHVVTSRKGRFQFSIEVQGRAAHSGMVHERGANAARELARIVETIESLTNYEETLTCNVGLMGAGESFNRVPHHAWAKGEVRAFKPEALGHAQSILEKLPQHPSVKSPVDNYTCKISVHIENPLPAWPSNSRSNALLLHWQTAAESLGHSVKAENRGGLSDANRLWEDFPVIDGLGPIGDNDHCSERSSDGSKDQEYLELNSLVPKTALNTLALRGIVSSR